MDWSVWTRVSGHFVEYDGQRWRYHSDQVPGLFQLYPLTGPLAGTCPLIVAEEVIERILNDTWYAFYGEVQVTVMMECQDQFYVMGPGDTPPSGVRNGCGDRDGWLGVVQKHEVTGLALRRQVGTVSLIDPPPLLNPTPYGPRLMDHYLLFEGVPFPGPRPSGRYQTLTTRDREFAVRHGFQPSRRVEGELERDVAEDEIIRVVESWLTDFRGERLRLIDMTADHYRLATACPHAANRLGFQCREPWRTLYSDWVPRSETCLHGVRLTFHPPEGYDPYASTYKGTSRSGGRAHVQRRWWQFW